jgi:uncharacterized protein (TIGR02266 family)
MQSAQKRNAPPQPETDRHALAGNDPIAQASGPQPVGEARRVHSRQDVELEVSLEVSLESESNFYLGLTENLSEGGLFIATHLVRPLGTEIEVSFKLPHVAEPTKAIGIVRWTREYSETSDTSPGMGVRFERISPEQVEQIREFLAARAPLFYDED